MRPEGYPALPDHAIDENDARGHPHATSPDFFGGRGTVETRERIDQHAAAMHRPTRQHETLSKKIAEKQGDLAAAASYLVRSARIARWTGDLDVAERELGQALRLARRASSKDIELIEGELSALKKAIADTTSNDAAPLDKSEKTEPVAAPPP